MDAREFAKLIRKRGISFEQGAKDLLATTALAADQAIVMATPVDTGRARANWQIGFDAWPVGEVSDFPAGDASGQFAIEEARKKLAEYIGQSSIWLVNNLPYITALNNGHSAQAPANFVQLSLRHAQNTARSHFKKLMGDL